MMANCEWLGSNRRRHDQGWEISRDMVVVQRVMWPPALELHVAELREAADLRQLWWEGPWQGREWSCASKLGDGEEDTEMPSISMLGR